MLLVDYNCTPALKKLEEKLQYYIENFYYDEVYEILNRPLHIDGSEFRIPYKAYYLRPSPTNLALLIANNKSNLYIKLLNAPYSLKPCDACLDFSILIHNHALFYYICRVNPEMIREIDTSETLCAAIEEADVEIVKYLVNQLNFAVFDDLYDHIEDTPNEYDILYSDSREVRNLQIRTFLAQAISEQEHEDEADRIRTLPISRNLMLEY
jgi:hypothetical protein